MIISYCFKDNCIFELFAIMHNLQQ